jgi:hypothetical protein
MTNWWPRGTEEDFGGSHGGWRFCAATNWLATASYNKNLYAANGVTQQYIYCRYEFTISDTTNCCRANLSANQFLQNGSHCKPIVANLSHTANKLLQT